MNCSFSYCWLFCFYAELIVLLQFYGVMSLVYLFFGIIWLVVSACQWRDLLRIQVQDFLPSFYSSMIFVGGVGGSANHDDENDNGDGEWW